MSRSFFCSPWFCFVVLIFSFLFNSVNIHLISYRVFYLQIFTQEKIMGRKSPKLEGKDKEVFVLFKYLKQQSGMTLLELEKNLLHTRTSL